MKEFLLTKLRSKETSMQEFRHSAERLSELLAIESSKHLVFTKKTIETPIAKTTGTNLSHPLVLVAILRSGVAMLPAFMKFYEEAEVGFLGIKRDEHTAFSSLYYDKLPRIQKDSRIMILEPMIATGGSALVSIKKLLEAGALPSNIIFASILVSKTGLQKIHDSYPEITILSASDHEALDHNYFLTPGLGDFGDRFFGS